MRRERERGRERERERGDHRVISQTELPVTVTAGGELKQSVAPGDLVMYLKQ